MSADSAAYQLISADSHVNEPPDLWLDRVPAALRDRAPRIEHFDEGDAWVIEGCYGELVEAAAGRCTELVFLNPGVDACLANNARRPWEPHKYASFEQQNSMLGALQTWVAEYYTRNGSWSYAAHRRIFDAHDGLKIEHTRLAMPGEVPA